MPPPEDLRIVEDAAELFRTAAGEFLRLASQAVESRGRFCVALSGGSTPKKLYSLLAGGQAGVVPWDKSYFFFGDERHVPPDDPESNYRMVNEAMFSKVPVPPENVFRVHAEKDAAVAAREYEETLRSFFNQQANQLPRFDLILLGVGPDGHTASLFPGSAALNESKRLVVANWVEKFKTWRITLTFPVLNHAACVMFLASGADKAGILHEVFENPTANLPSQKVRPEHGRLVWLVDRPAVASLSR
ncbi:MAG: 6-phosphogluconolactonase [Terriglobales bacterium]